MVDWFLGLRGCICQKYHVDQKMQPLSKTASWYGRRPTLSWIGLDWAGPGQANARTGYIRLGYPYALPPTLGYAIRYSNSRLHHPTLSQAQATLRRRRCPTLPQAQDTLHYCPTPRHITPRHSTPICPTHLARK